MALFGTREGKLNVIIFLLILQLFVFSMYIRNNGKTPQVVSQRNADAKQSPSQIKSELENPPKLQATQTDSKPAIESKPADPGQESKVNKPIDPGQPINGNKPADPGQPINENKPADPGQPVNENKPADPNPFKGIQPAMPNFQLKPNNIPALNLQAQNTNNNPGAPKEQSPPAQQKVDCGPLPSDEALRTMSHESLSQLYHSYVTGTQIRCSNMVRHGNYGDGGWDVCLDPPFNIQKPCLVYSFGIANEWSFDDAITSAYGCELHAYDPSMNVNDHDRKPNLHFHRTGLDSADTVNSRSWRMRTFGSLLRENGHSEATIDVLKIDIEASEWGAFPEMLAADTFKNVKQFCFEIHMKLNGQPEADSEKYIRGIKLLKDFYHYGFRIFKTHKNMDAKYISKHGMQRTGCHEVFMLKTSSKTTGCP